MYRHNIMFQFVEPIDQLQYAYSAYEINEALRKFSLCK